MVIIAQTKKILINQDLELVLLDDYLNISKLKLQTLS